MRVGRTDARGAWTRRSVRLRLTVWYGGALTVLLGVLALVVYGVLAATLQQNAEQQLAQRAVQIADTLNVGETGANVQESATPGELVLLYDAGGQLLEGQSDRYAPPALPGWAAGTVPRDQIIALGADRWLVRAAPVGLTETGPPLGHLVVGRSFAPVDTVLGDTLSAFLLAGPLVILLACGVGYFLAGRALAPVAAFTRTARNIQATRLSRRLDAGTRHDELGELAATFNDMLARLETAFIRERRFTADAAHELRAPLAVVQAETSLALARPRTDDEYRRVLGVVDAEVARMGRLIDGLLTLARGDEGQAHLVREPLCLTPLCRALLAQMAPGAAARGVALTGALVETPPVFGDPTWLAQVVTNLLDNALKYTPPGGRVQLRLAQQGRDVTLVVEDTGPGINAADLPHIFERFYRADKARQRDAAASGFGLGLALCAWVVEAHGGAITVTSQLGQGTRFTVALPVAAPDPAS